MNMQSNKYESTTARAIKTILDAANAGHSPKAIQEAMESMRLKLTVEFIDNDIESVTGDKA